MGEECQSKQPPDHCLREAAAHVAHDIRGLRDAYGHRGNRHAYTAWFVHCRSVMDFFDCEGSRPEDDIYACDYFDGSGGENGWMVIRKKVENPRRYSEFRGAVNKLAAHLTYSRIAYAKRDFCPSGEITDFLLAVAEIFLKHLPDDRASWFGGLRR